MPVVAKLDSFVPSSRKLFGTAYTALLIYSRSLQGLRLQFSILHPASQVFILPLEVHPRLLNHPVGLVDGQHTLPIASATRRCISM